MLLHGTEGNGSVRRCGELSRVAALAIISGRCRLKILGMPGLGESLGDALRSPSAAATAVTDPVSFRLYSIRNTQGKACLSPVSVKQFRPSYFGSKCIMEER